MEIAESHTPPFVKTAKYLFVALLAAALVYGIASVYRNIYENEKFKLEKILVNGNRYVSKNEILALAKIENSRNIFKVNIKELERKIAMNSQFSKVEVERVFPSSLLIKVNEREPVAFIGEDKRLETDKDGVIFPAFKHSFYDKKLYTVAGASININELGKKCSEGDLGEVLRIIEQIKSSKSPYVNEITRINASALKDLELVAENSGVIYKIGLGNWDEKFDRLDNILKKLKDERTNILYIDLRFRDEAVVMFKNAKKQP